MYNYAKRFTTENNEEEVEQSLIGVVHGCEKLNMRNAPAVSAEVLCELKVGTELVIDLDDSNDEWFSVCNSAGLTGFCMKKYVSIK